MTDLHPYRLQAERYGTLASLQLYRLHAELCRTLANPKRLQILECLAAGERSVGEIAAATGMSLVNVSQHLALMRAKGVVTGRREGTTVYYRIANPKMIEACALVREVLMEQFRDGARLAEMAEARE